MKYLLCSILCVMAWAPILLDTVSRGKRKSILKLVYQKLPAFVKKSRLLTGKAGMAEGYLRPGADPEKAEAAHVMKKMRLFSMALAAAVSAGCLYGCLYQPPSLEDGVIWRAGAQESARSVDLEAEIGSQKEEVTVTVLPRRYREEERADLFARVRDYIDQTLPGDNPDLAHVEQDLVFVTDYPEPSVEITWMPEDYRLIRQDGTLGDLEDAAFPLQTRVTVVIRYDVFEEEYSLPVTVTGRRLGEEEARQEALLRSLQAADEASREEEALRLPKRVAGEETLWRYRAGSYLPGILALFLAAGLLLVYRQEQKLDKELEKRAEELERAYPAFVQRMVLMLGAGMTVRRSWESMLAYEQEEEGSRYLRREMLYALRCMNAGIPETKVYQAFGRRLPGYEAFSQLLVQIIRKGSSGMQEMMLREAGEAERKRRDLAKRLGETAGTKLLLPMMLLLILVLAIVMAPAMLSM